jgi:type IV pilus assembly protein PilA
MRRNGGFTLIEIMIVVAIIALLAALALPTFLRAKESSQNAKFVNALRTASGAIEMYVGEHNGQYPADANRGVVPNGLATYLDATFDWTKPTPIGGQWDWDFNVFGVTAAVSVVGPTAQQAQLLSIDRAFDDGDLSSGIFQSLTAAGNTRYIDIVEK